MSVSKHRILVIAGSSRNGSFNGMLARAAAGSLRTHDVDVLEIDLRACRLPLYDGDLEQQEGVPAAAAELHESFRGSAGILIVSPEYNASIPPLLKNSIDWVSRVKDHGGIPAAFGAPVFALASASPGGLGGYRGLMALRQSLELGLGARVIPPMVTVPRAHEAFDAKGALLSENHAKGLDKLCAALVAATGVGE